ncbi:FecR domain-containing protein [Xenophilus arseniciresistens]|uniref:FecR domain-containing protein n=1 Tax=Xenophilus arseniciresistens TaxID=1283306 RepID=A0AAE3N802_9BURK|nr:FecR domain-containing protein [Xenophilus arseniciresistens]MDA7415587.1 FecR domain-containing protein [Xenophilus arseniciresistens]
MTPAAAPSPLLAQQAAEWLVALDADDAEERARAQAGFAHWKQADPRHAAAAAPLEALLAQMQPWREDGDQAAAVRQALQAGARAGATATRSQRSRRRTVLACAAAALLALGTAQVWFGSEWGQALHADLRTAPGQWEQRTLPDGTRVALGSGSAVDWHFDARQRRLQLLQGEILVDVAPDTTRPLLVSTPQGRIRALGTQLLVQREPDATRLTLLESSAAVQAHGGASAPEVVVQTGEQVRLSQGQVQPLTTLDAQQLRQEWLRRELVVIDQPLPEVLRTLARHRPGRLGFDESELAHLRVTAVLPLDQPERALALLAASFPQLRMSRFTNYWVSIDLQTPTVRGRAG